MLTDPTFYLAAIPAVILVGLAKGGFAGIGTVSLPLMALAIDPVQAAAILLPIMMVQDVVSVGAYWKKWDRRNLMLLVPGAIVGILIGYLLASRVSMAAFNVALGLIAAAFALRYLLLPQMAPKQGGSLAGYFWGTVSGFTSMIAHSGAPPFQIYVMPQKLERDTFVGTSNAFFGIVNWLKFPAFVALGEFTTENVTTTAVLMPLAIASTWAGVLLVRRVPAEPFYKFIYLLLTIVGLKLMWEGGTALLGA